MKINIFLVIVFLCTQSLKAQTEKGKILVASGSDMAFIFGKNNLVYDGNKLRETKTKDISLEPTLGYFIINDLAIGLAIPIDYVRNEYIDIREEQTSYGIAPFLRYYWFDGKFKPYLNMDIGYLFVEIKSNDVQITDDKFGGLIIDAGIGISAFFNDFIAFDTQVAYGFSKMTYDGDTDLKLKTNAIGMLLGVTVIF